MKGTFDYDGDCYYTVEWEKTDEGMFVTAVVGSVDITQYLNQNVLNTLYDLAWDEYYG